MSVPPPHRRTLPDVPINEAGMRQLEEWLLTRMRSLLKGAGGDGLHWGVNHDTRHQGLTLDGHGAFSSTTDGADYTVDTTDSGNSATGGGVTITGFPTTIYNSLAVNTQGGYVNVDTSSDLIGATFVMNSPSDTPGSPQTVSLTLSNEAGAEFFTVEGQRSGNNARVLTVYERGDTDVNLTTTGRRFRVINNNTLLFYVDS